MKKIYTHLTSLILFVVITNYQLKAQCPSTTVPYYEGFQSITSNNQLPTCWTSSSASVTCLTYTTPSNNYAAFYYNPGGTNYFWSKAVQLVTGVTYSAALFYKTDFTGGTNWSNLSILFGPNQSAAGLIPIVSNTAAINSPAYTLLSNTFLVPANGVYYFAIRAVGSNTGPAQYLNWDDLSITIPCGLNSQNTPTLGASQSNYTICSGQSFQLNASGFGPYSYQWSTGSSTSTMTDTPFSNTTYSVTLTNTITLCQNTYTYYVTVNPSPNVLAFVSNPNVCAGESVVITASGADSYVWSNGAAGASTTVSPVSTNSYIVQGTNSYSCSNNATVFISVKPSPSFTISGTTATICPGESVILSVSGNAQSYTWTGAGGVTGSSVNVSPASTGNILVSATGTNNCVKSLGFLVTVNDCTGLSELNSNDNSFHVFPNPGSADFTVMLGSEIAGHLSVSDLNGKEVYVGDLQSGEQSLSIKGLQTGLYFFRLQSEQGTKVIKVLKQ